MTFLAPLWLVAAAVAALGVVVLHLVSTQRPPAARFPTARFVPEDDARAATRTSRPADIALLATRVTVLLLLGAAAARPVARLGGVATGRVFIVDRSRSTLADVRDSALALWRAGDAVVLFDSAARRLALGEGDSLRQLKPLGVRGALSPAIVAAVRAARAFRSRADSLELVVVSPLTVDELDAATPSLMAQWHGPVRFVRTQLRLPVVPAVTLESADANDELRPMVSVLNADAAAATRHEPPATHVAHATVRVVRHPLSATDSAAARLGAAIVHWAPTDDQRAHAAGVWAGNATVVAQLATLDPARSAAAATAVTARIVARWADGQPAAFESALGSGCIRTVRVGVPTAGDIALQPAFIAVARWLAGPCAGAQFAHGASDTIVRVLFQPRPASARPASALAVAAIDSGAEESSLSVWLVSAALLLLLAELVLRRPAWRRA